MMPARQSSSSIQREGLPSVKRDADENYLSRVSHVFLEVAYYQCPRRGRYRLTRLIDRHGAGKGLPVLKDELTADCPKRWVLGFHDQCGAYFPKLGTGTKE